jgi:hypothetical protein
VRSGQGKRWNAACRANVETSRSGMISSMTATMAGSRNLVSERMSVVSLG